MPKLYLISTPIGNLNDITERAKKHLEFDGIFLAEDTRVFKSLLGHLGIPLEGKEITSFHQHTDTKSWVNIYKILDEGRDISLVSDAGSPIVSDPAFPLVQEALKRSYEIESIPGVSSVIVALELSGLPPCPLFFHGFFPRDARAQQTWLLTINEQPGTHIIFESPHRIYTTLKCLSVEFPNGQFAVCRELTKKFETVYRYQAEDYEAWKDKIIAKGEFVICLYHQTDKHYSFDESKLVELAQLCLESPSNKKNLAKLLATITQKKSKDVYHLLVQDEDKE